MEMSDLLLVQGESDGSIPMAWENPDDETIRDLLASAKTIAVIGCSPRPNRTSHQIAATMQRRGYRIVPVHPAGGSILGETVYPNLAAIPDAIEIDIVDVFRRAETIIPIAHQAVSRAAKGLWLQQGIVNRDAYDIATAAGLTVVMDRCIAVLHRLLM